MNTTALGYLGTVELHDLYTGLLDALDMHQHDLQQAMANSSDFFLMQLKAHKKLAELDRMAYAFDTFYSKKERLAMYKVILTLIYTERHGTPEQKKAVHRKAEFIYEN